MNKALFLDRDGVINKNFGHVHRVENFKFRKGIINLVKLFHDKNFLIIVVTNQAGIGKGFYSKDDFILLNKWMIAKFQETGIKITETFFCPHKIEDKCNCRKPKPGMLLKAIKDYNIDINLSFLIGDKESDMIAGKSAKIKNILIVKNSINILFKKIRRYL